MLGVVLVALASAQAPIGDVPAALVDHVVGPHSPHFDLELLYTEGRYREMLEAARERYRAHPEDADLAWHMARAYYEIGEDFERTNQAMDKESWYREMWDVVEGALAKKPDDPHLRFARGIAIGRYGTTRGVLASLFLAKQVEADWVAAATSGYKYRSLGGEEEMPCDVYQALAIYYRLVPDWWIVQAIAGTRGDLHKSVAYGEKAVACSPHRIRNLKELGVAQVCLGKRTEDAALVDKGLGTLRRALAEVPSSASEKVDLNHVPRLLADPDLACAYSRDGQQDLDRSNLPEAPPP